jgi:hypothetical protein
MDQNVALQSALRDLDLGQYTRATSSLTALRNAHENDVAATYHYVNSELVRAHLLRGASVAALEAVDESLVKFPQSFLEELETRQLFGELELDQSCVYLVLRMQKALLACLIDGSLEGSVKISARLAKLSRPHTQHELYTRQIAGLFILLRELKLTGMS